MIINELDVKQKIWTEYPLLKKSLSVIAIEILRKILNKNKFIL